MTPQEIAHRKLQEGKITFSQFLKEMLVINTERIKKGEL